MDNFIPVSSTSEEFYLFNQNSPQCYFHPTDWVIEDVIHLSSQHAPSTFISCGSVKIFLHFAFEK